MSKKQSNKKMMKLTLGCDPEYFLAKGNGEVISACGLIGGTKEKPKSIGKGVMVQEDNVAVEFNTEPVVHEMNSEALFNKAHGAFQHVQAWINKNVGKHLYSVANVWEFKKDQLTHPACHVFGCEPDRNAHLSGDFNMPIDPLSFGDKRCVGGHIHCGYDVANVKIPPYALVQLGEALSTVPYAGLIDFDIVGSERCKMYGKAGAFRLKEYGFEYRTPSNSWLFRHRRFATMFANVILWAINNQAEASTVYDMINFLEIQEQLNSGGVDPVLAHRMADIYNKYVSAGAWDGQEEGRARIVRNRAGVPPAAGWIQLQPVRVWQGAQQAAQVPAAQVDDHAAQNLDELIRLDNDRRERMAFDRALQQQDVIFGEDDLGVIARLPADGDGL